MGLKCGQWPDSWFWITYCKSNPRQYFQIDPTLLYLQLSQARLVLVEKTFLCCGPIASWSKTKNKIKSARISIQEERGLNCLLVSYGILDSVFIFRNGSGPPGGDVTSSHCLWYNRFNVAQMSHVSASRSGVEGKIISNPVINKQRLCRTTKTHTPGGHNIRYTCWKVLEQVEFLKSLNAFREKPNKFIKFNSSLFLFNLGLDLDETWFRTVLDLVQSWCKRGLDQFHLDWNLV